MQEVVKSTFFKNLGLPRFSSLHQAPIYGKNKIPQNATIAEKKDFKVEMLHNKN